MANIIYLDTYEFVPTNNTKKLYGFIMYDNYEYQVDTTLSKEEAYEQDILTLLTTVYNNISLESEIFNAIIDFGCMINGQFYDSEELKPIIEKIKKNND